MSKPNFSDTQDMSQHMDWDWRLFGANWFLLSFIIFLIALFSHSALGLSIGGFLGGVLFILLAATAITAAIYMGNRKRKFIRLRRTITFAAWIVLLLSTAGKIIGNSADTNLHADYAPPASPMVSTTPADAPSAMQLHDFPKNQPLDPSPIEQSAATQEHPPDHQKMLSAVANRAIEQYPFLDDRKGSTTANPEAITEVKRIRDMYISKGNIPEMALSLAICEVVPKYGYPAPNPFDFIAPEQNRK